MSCSASYFIGPILRLFKFDLIFLVIVLSKLNVDGFGNYVIIPNMFLSKLARIFSSEDFKLPKRFNVSYSLA